MDNSPKYYPTILSSHASNVDVMAWDAVLDAWKKKNYLDSFHKTLKYINPSVFKKYANKERTEFRIPHGSVIVTIKLENDVIKIRAPFLRMPKEQSVPLMRQVAQLNFTPLRLAQIYLRDDELTFFGDCDLALSEPYKIYDMLYEICINADNYDDQFIEDFGAEHIQKPEVTFYPTAKLDKMWEQALRIIEETRSFVQYFEEKRWHGSAWDMLNMSIKRLDYCFAPQGTLRNEIEKVIGFMQTKGDMMVQIDTAKKFFDRIEQEGKEKFLKNIYQVDIFIPYKSIGLIQNFKNQLQPSFERASKERNEGNHMMCAMTCLYAFYHLFYSYNVLNDTADFISRSLKKASNDPWKKASSTLWGCLNDIMTGRHIPRSGKGLFSSIFNR